MKSKRKKCFSRSPRYSSPTPTWFVPECFSSNDKDHLLTNKIVIPCLYKTVKTLELEVCTLLSATFTSLKSPERQWARVMLDSFLDSYAILALLLL